MASATSSAPILFYCLSHTLYDNPTLSYPSSIWGTTAAPILFHCPNPQTPYDHLVLPLFAIAHVTTAAPILFHCPIPHTSYDNPTLCHPSSLLRL